MPFPLTTPFTYTGGALEIAVLWDMSGIAASPPATPAFSNADGDNGAIKWRWSATTGTNLVTKKTSSSLITSGSSLTLANQERANMKLVYETSLLSTLTFGTGTSSSSSRGPIQVAGGSSTVISTAFNQVYTPTELITAGMTIGDIITELRWDLNSTNMLQGAGNASFQIYMKNSVATSATADTWGNTILGSTLVLDRTFNTIDNFPGVTGYMDFPLTNPFTYTGGAIEIAVLWDMSGIIASPPATPAFNNADGDNGAIKWRWSATPGMNLVSKRTGSSLTTSGSSLSLAAEERANIQMVFREGPSTPLPVELSYFNGTAIEEGNLLAWETQVEINNAGFEIQRSFDRQGWQEMGFVEGKDTRSNRNHYSFLDTRPAIRNVYYRLKQVDVDGAFRYSSILLIKTPFEEINQVKMYPNPVYDQVTIEGFRGTLTIYNLVGQPVKNIHIHNEDQEVVSLADLANGQYLIDFRPENESHIIRQKIIKLAE